jgi:glycosyltransferase involved in cell wall biosynthesis
MKRILIAAGNPCRVGFRGGQPYYFYAAGRAVNFIHDALPLAPERLMLRKALWNLGNLATHGTPFGFQYSRMFRHHLFAPYREKCGAAEYISYFPLLPPEPWSSKWIVNYYIDATLRQNFDDYGLGAKLSRHMRARAIDQECRNYVAATRIVCRSAWAASSVVHDYGIDPQKVHVIVPGASVDEPVEEEMSRSTCPTLNPLRLGLVGKDWERKGLRFLLSIVDGLELRGFDTELRIIGPQTDELPKHRRIRSLGYIDKGKDTLRFVREIRSWHFGCLFPRAEALPSFLRECLRLGVPILARRIGGVAEAVPSGLGFLFEPDASPDEVIDLLIGFVDEPVRYAKLRAQVAARSKEFSWNRTLEKFVALWQGSDEFAYERNVNAHG